MTIALIITSTALVAALFALALKRRELTEAHAIIAAQDADLTETHEVARLAVAANDVACQGWLAALEQRDTARQTTVRMMLRAEGVQLADLDAA